MTNKEFYPLRAAPYNARCALSKIKNAVAREVFLAGEKHPEAWQIRKRQFIEMKTQPGNFSRQAGQFYPLESKRYTFRAAESL